jgi:DNA invertase Pin-like site-specific DNA recombinase
MAPGPGWAEVCPVSSRRWPSLSARVSGSQPDAVNRHDHHRQAFFYIFGALTEFETNVITDRMVAGRQAGRKTRPGLNGGPNRCSSGPDLGRA